MESQSDVAYTFTSRAGSRAGDDERDVVKDKSSCSKTVSYEISVNNLITLRNEKDMERIVTNKSLARFFGP